MTATKSENPYSTISAELEQLALEYGYTSPQNTGPQQVPDTLKLRMTLIRNLNNLHEAAMQNTQNQILHDASLDVWKKGNDFARALLGNPHVSDKLYKKIEGLSVTVESVTALLKEPTNIKAAEVTKKISQMYSEMSDQYPVKKRANTTTLHLAVIGAVFTLAGIFCVALAVLMPHTAPMLAVCLSLAAMHIGMGAYCFSIASTAGKDSANTSMHRNVTAIYKSLLDVTNKACEKPLDKAEETEEEAKRTMSP
jgi:hypothetical protein